MFPSLNLLLNKFTITNNITQQPPVVWEKLVSHIVREVLLMANKQLLNCMQDKHCGFFDLPKLLLQGS